MGDEKPASERAGDGKHDSATLLSRAERDAGNGSSVEPSSVGGARESKQGHGDEPDDGGGSDGKSDHSGQGRGAATGDETGEPSSVADGHRSSTGENGAVSEAGGSVTGSSTSAPVGQPISDLAVVRGMWEMQSVVQFCQVLRTTIGLSPAFREREAYERAVLEPELTESLNAPNELTCELVFRLCTVYKARDSSRCVEGWTQLLRSVLSTEERWREMWEANPLGVDGMGRFAQLSVQTRVEVLYALCLWKTDDVDEIRDALDSLVKFDDEAVRMGPRQLPFGVGRRPPVAPCVPPGDMFGDVPDSELEEEERVTWYFGDGLWTFQEQPPKATRDHVPFSNDPLMCSTCQSRSCKDKLVHCAACDRGYHSFCLKPPVEPGTSTWFCLPCLERLKNRKRHDAARSNSRYMNRKRTVEARLRVTAKRHAAVRASFDPEDPKLATALEGPIGRKPKITEPGCRVCGGLHKPAKGLLCDYCDGEYHMFCLSPPLRAVPQGDWACPSCKALLDSVEALKPVEIVAEPGCQVCGVDDDNGVLLCDACESECHMACLDPPLERVPEGDWFCPKCLVDVRQNPPTRGLDPGRRVDESDLEASDSDDEADDEGASDDEDSDVETTSRSSGGGAKRAGAGAGAGSSNGGQPITNGEEGKSGDAAASDGGSRSKGGTPAGGTAQTVAQMANRLGVSDRELRDDVPVGKTPAFVLNCRDAGRAGTWRCTSVEFQELEGLVATLNSSSSDDEGAAKTMLTSLLEKRREKWEREKSARRRALQWASVPRRRSDRSETLLAKQEEEARKRREFQERQRLQQEQRERERAERQRKIAEEKARVAAEEATARAAEQAREDALQKAIADVQRASRFLGNVLTAVMDLLCADEEAAFPFLEPVDVVGLGLSVGDSKLRASLATLSELTLCRPYSPELPRCDSTTNGLLHDPDPHRRRISRLVGLRLRRKTGL